ncbi:Mannosyl-oligosaccharide 1,2-alpha-mannosidase [Purpureocillium takamizusanense]|uniref:alpha-1,2-Mannosidase n=1 Tax=Purpureocillium takamizusanense TaxID=2060973 RepID=A0A9Q8V8I6_9HYPO|nr:Mannosyl-oligosaccharide 1,2-alpha-mannosidase [Purpureocillium takamizusanense]UNI15842.1 Mannosyl-oligosaccharide 1,2-alpha-mannosidase [Purpureocillium takamizusanense]
MLNNQLQGRLGRRYIALIVFAVLALLLWRSFGGGGFGSRTTGSRTVGSVRLVPSSYDWSKAQQFHPAADIKPLPAGSTSRLPKVQARPSAERQNDIAKSRKDAVRRAFVKSWEAYKTHAWTKDELMPLSGKGKQTFSGWSAQLVDALDSLWIMGLKDDFALAVKEVAVIDWAKVNDGRTINLFEVTIRYLGGLLAAYDLSREPVLLAKAVELGDALYAGFDTPNRLPSHWLDYNKAKAGEQTADLSMSGAAGGSLSLEFTRLSQITGDAKYYDATERIKHFFYRFQNATKIPGLWPMMLNYRDETMDGEIFTLGAGADSLYEYLPKMHALLGGRDPEYEQMTAKALDAARDTLLFRPMTPKDDNILMAGNVDWDDGNKTLTPEMQHLTCFVGGTYGLAGQLLGRKEYVDLASRLAAGCVWAYDSFATNIMPEISELVACPSLDGPCPYSEAAFPTTMRGRPSGVDLPAGFTRVRDPRYLLRPEAIESVFYMWRITGDQVWRDAAWRMWQGIVRETETELAFASIEDVKVHSSEKSDSMETFWLSETTKYFYLIFDDEATINLDEWVLNTEAHPLRRPAQK